MKNFSNQCDERQVIERGRAFQYGFLTLFALMTLCFMLSSGFELHVFDDFTTYMFCTWPAITVCFTMMIVRDAFDCINRSPGIALFSIYGLGGAFVIVSTVIEIVRGKAAIFAEGLIGHAAAELLCGFCCVLVCVVYWIHAAKRRKALKNAEKE